MSNYKTETKTETFDTALGMAFGEIEQLAEEMGEWRDNMEEKLSHTQKYSDVSECADTLGDHTEVPEYSDDDLGKIEVAFGETVFKSKSRKGSVSRSVRLGNATSRLSACVDAIETKLNESEELEDGADGKLAEDDVSGLEELRDSLQETIDTVEGVEFPGMFG